MKTALLLLFLAASLTSPKTEPNSKTIGRCPNGHKTLKDVPILYGLPPDGGIRRKKYDAAIKAGKFASGSDAFSPNDDPAIQVTCMTCGYAHREDSPGQGSWTRVATNTKGFKVPITKLATSFPQPPAKLLRGAITYYQVLEDKALRVSSEFVYYTTAESFGDVRNKILAWMKSQELDLAVTKDSDGSVEWGQDYKPIWIRIEFNQKSGRTHVDLCSSHRE